MALNGVRQYAWSEQRAECEWGTGTERERRMAVSLRESLGEIADPRKLDATVEEVFQLMLGVNCRREVALLEPDPEWVTAVVGFGGILSGACIFRSGGVAARRMAACMTGVEVSGIDDTVKDGIGEICNMLAGSWKGRMPELAARCGLSVPAVITGRDYELRVQSPEFRLGHVYEFDGVRFEVTILCDGVL